MGALKVGRNFLVGRQEGNFCWPKKIYSSSRELVCLEKGVNALSRRVGDFIFASLSMDSIITKLLSQLEISTLFWYRRPRKPALNASETALPLPNAIYEVAFSELAFDWNRNRAAGRELSQCF